MHPSPPDRTDDTHDGPGSVCVLSSLSGAAVTVWSPALTDTVPRTEVRLRLAPDRPVVIGRAKSGHQVPYLDPAYQPTPVVPGTDQSVLKEDGAGKDVSVSRGHFTLRAAAGGVVLVNGVPGVDGGTRPPTNWTYLLAPEHRVLDPGEEYLIPAGSGAVIALPNGTELRLDAR